MTADRDRKLEIMGVEKEENAENDQQQEMVDAIDAIDLDHEYFTEAVVNDDAVFKEISDHQKTLMVEAKWFLEKEEYKQILSNIKAFRVLKMP